MLKLKTLAKKARFVFEWSEDNNGSHGWLLRGMPSFDVVQGMALAHDCLEHFTHETDGAESEFTAFGVILWGRFCNDYYGSFKPYTETQDRLFKNLGAEVAGFYLTLGCPQAATGYENPMLDEEIEDIIKTIQIGMRDEFEALDDLEPEHVDQAIRVYTSWIRYGYLSAENSWGKWMSGFQFVNMFFNLENHIDSYHSIGGYGDVLVINVDRVAGCCNVRKGFYDMNGRIRYDYPGEEV